MNKPHHLPSLTSGLQASTIVQIHDDYGMVFKCRRAKLQRDEGGGGRSIWEVRSLGQGFGPTLWDCPALMGFTHHNAQGKHMVHPKHT
jgi:hypothetical protein